MLAGLLIAGIAMLATVLCGRMNVRYNWVYHVLAAIAWAGVMASGIHATVAGVLMAMLIPVRAGMKPEEFFERSRKSWEELKAGGLTQESMIHDHKQMEALDDMYLAVEDMRPPAISLEHHLQPLQSFLILPIFAFFKAGVTLDATALAELSGPISLGVILGLIVGKQIGVLAFSWLAIRSGRASMPENVTWQQLWGASILAGVGFTMSVFISELAFSDASLIAEAKVAVLAASVLAGAVGFIVLGRVLPKETS